MTESARHRHMVRVNYSEVDQMGVVYHARYIVWLDEARTEFLRATGMSYREFEAMGFRLAVGELAIRYRRPARYDDLVAIQCWVEACESRRVRFEYSIRNAETDTLLAEARTDMMVLSEAMKPTRLPPAMARRLRAGGGQVSA